MTRLQRLATCAIIACLTITNPVCAADETDDAERIGLAAALGLTTADGKTTLGTGAGAIEAALLESDAINLAGATIVALAKNGGASGKVLLLTRSETINAAAYFATKKRLDAVLQHVQKATCTAPSPAKGLADLKRALEKAAKDFGGGHRTFSVKMPNEDIVKLSVGDILPAVATSTSFATIPLTVEDRAIVAAMLINQNAALPDKRGTGAEPARWQAVSGWSKGTSQLTLQLPGEIQGDPNNSTILRDYSMMLSAADNLRHCSDDNKAKAAVAVVDAYATALNAVTDKAPVAPLALAVQQESLYTTVAPHVLRLSVEQSGGTSRTRSGLLYTLGIPGAAVVSAGLLISFRLIDTADGTTKTAGIVRCAVPPKKMGSIRRFAKADPSNTDTVTPKATCSYIVG